MSLPMLTFGVPLLPDTMTIPLLVTPVFSKLGSWLPLNFGGQASLLMLQSFFLIVQYCFSLILIVYLLGEVDAFTPILRTFSFVPYLPFVSLIFSRT